MGPLDDMIASVIGVIFLVGAACAAVVGTGFYFLLRWLF